MSSDDRYCPACGIRFKWYEKTCDECGAALVTHRPGGDPKPDAALVPVFQSAEVGAIDLARVTLEQEGIEYVAREAAEPIRRPADDRLGRWMNARRSAVALFVLENDAERARELLADLQQETGPSPVGENMAPAGGVPRRVGVATIRLYDADLGTFIGRISEEQLGALLEHLEQESDQDRSYYIDAATIDMLAGAGADETLVNLLRGAVAGREGVDVRWSDES
jgi:hypothetical protein